MAAYGGEGGNSAIMPKLRSLRNRLINELSGDSAHREIVRFATVWWEGEEEEAVLRRELTGQLWKETHFGRYLVNFPLLLIEAL